MLFKIDENLPTEIAEYLRSAGHDAVTVVDQGIKGFADLAVLAVCLVEGRVQVTLDTYFLDIAATRQTCIRALSCSDRSGKRPSGSSI